MQPPLLERDRAGCVLDEALSAAASGGSSLVIVRGAAGLGKTALLRRAAERAQAAGAGVLSAAGSELERDHPYGVVAQLFRRRPPEDVAPAALLFALFTLLLGLNDEAPQLLVVDDLHWADAPSLVALLHLIHRAADLRTAFVVALRPGEGTAQEFVRRLLALPSARSVDLEPLSDAAVATLVREQTGRAPPALVGALARATAGNPFLLRELLATGVTEADAAQVGRLAPDRVVNVTVERLDRLGADAQALARAAAVLDHAAPLSVVAGLAEVDAARARAALDALAAVELLTPEPVAFAHPLLRAAVEASVPPAQRAHLHARAARGLDAIGASAAQVAAHLLRAPRAGDAWTVERLGRAADEALGQDAPASAVAFLRRALEEPPPAGRERWLLRLARAEAAAADPAAASRLREALAALEPPRERAAVALELGRLLHVGGQVREAAAVLDRALQELGRPDPTCDDLAAELEASWMAVARLDTGLWPRAAERVEALLAAPAGGERPGERALLAQIANERVWAAAPREEAISLALRALGDGALIEQETADGVSWPVAAGVLAWTDAFDAFDAVTAHARADAERRGSLRALANLAYGTSFAAYHRGRLQEGLADAEHAVAAAAQGWGQFLPAAHAHLAWIQIELGHLDAAEATLFAGVLEEGWPGSPMYAMVLEARARLLLAREEPAAALAAARDAGRILADARIVNPSVVPWRSRAALASAQTGDREAAVAHAAEEVELARRFGAPRALGGALAVLGTVGGELAPLEEARAVLAESPAVVERCRALVLLGAARRRSGAVRAAREELREALALAERMGAELLVQAARAELEAAGARPRRAAHALTPSEQRVAELAAAGRSNAEIARTLFVERRTVETHLTNTYRKLAISSRDELADALGKDRGGSTMDTAAPAP